MARIVEEAMLDFLKKYEFNNHTIYRIEMPTPLPLVDENAYLIDAGNGLTLVDPGMLWPDRGYDYLLKERYIKQRLYIKGRKFASHDYLLDELVPDIDAGKKDKGQICYHVLERALFEMGRDVKDIGQIMFTHNHLDHYGLAAHVKRESGGKVLGFSKGTLTLTDFSGSMKTLEVAYGRLLKEADIPHDTHDEILRPTNTFFSGCAESVAVDGLYNDTGSLELSEKVVIEAAHTPGHSDSSVLLRIVDVGSVPFVLSGDSILKEITPNVFYDGLSSDHLVGLSAYTRSVRIMRPFAGAANVVLTGHGDPIYNQGGSSFTSDDFFNGMVGNISGQLNNIMKICTKDFVSVYDVISGNNPEMIEFYGKGRIGKNKMLLAAMEVRGLCDFLVDNYLLDREYDNGVYRYRKKVHVPQRFRFSF